MTSALPASNQSKTRLLLLGGLCALCIALFGWRMLAADRSTDLQREAQSKEDAMAAEYQRIAEEEGDEPEEPSSEPPEPPTRAPVKREP
ncbi:MAG: hypothetical protein H7Y88_01675 [Phycisphaerales bacterium]|nr:hypothetical protein [Phycisphaerales bacterium]